MGAVVRGSVDDCGSLVELPDHNFLVAEERRTHCDLGVEVLGCSLMVAVVVRSVMIGYSRIEESSRARSRCILGSDSLDLVAAQDLMSRMRPEIVVDNLDLQVDGRSYLVVSGFVPAVVA